jgi:hypothetical protein
MNIIVNRPQLVRAVLLYLNKNFGNLTQKTRTRYPDSVFYVNSNDEILMEYDKENEYVWLHYDQIWSKIESLFPLNYSEIQSIMKHWLEETYKLKGVTPDTTVGISKYCWRRLTN